MPETPKHVIEMITPAFLNKYPSRDFEFQSVCHNVNQLSLTLFRLLVSRRAGSPWKCDICPLVQRAANKPSTFRCRLKTFTVIFSVQAALVFLRRSLLKSSSRLRLWRFVASAWNSRFPFFQFDPQLYVWVPFCCSDNH